LDAKPSQVQRVARKVAEAKPGQGHLTPGILAEVFPALGFAARFRKICKNKSLQLLGIPLQLILPSAIDDVGVIIFHHWKNEKRPLNRTEIENCGDALCR
jgi:hypothetical protein